MCLMCEEEDLYFLYLEQRERAQREARGETTPANANWLWPSFVTAPTAQAPDAQRAPARPLRKSEFACDTPE